jgi:hypothetical protein
MNKIAKASALYRKAINNTICTVTNGVKCIEADNTNSAFLRTIVELGNNNSDGFIKMVKEHKDKGFSLYQAIQNHQPITDYLKEHKIDLVIWC